MRLAVMILIPLELALASMQCAAETYSISPDGLRLTVRTEHVEAVFDGPDIVRLKNLFTGERYTGKQSKAGSSILRLRVQQSSDVVPTGGSWRRPEGEHCAIFESEPAAEKNARLTMHVSGENGEIVLSCKGSLNAPGVYAIDWGMQNLDLSTASAILPVCGGQILSASTAGTSETFAYPMAWEAQFVVIEGREGSALVYSTDENARFKNLTYRRSKNSCALEFETENAAPFTDLTSADSTEWRIDCFKSDWRSAVSAYKKAMRGKSTGFYDRPAVVKQQTWPSKIRGSVLIVSNYNDTKLLDELAKYVKPRKTLLYFASWRRDGYDVNYPDYTGVHNLRAFIDHAHELGFKVMLHVDLPGVTPSNPVYEQVKQHQLKDKHSLQPMGWWWEKDVNVPQRFAFINPASKEFRRIFVDAMCKIVQDYASDALHLDVSAPMWNDGNGLIDGMNYCQGSVQLHKELLAALPNTVLVGESLNEYLAPYEHFAQRWPWKYGSGRHPVCDFLFGDLTVGYGYLGQPNPDSSPASFLEYVRAYEVQGVMPTMVVNSTSDLGPEKPGADRWFRVIRVWQDNDLWPDWSAKWPKKVIFLLKGKNGVRARIWRTKTGVEMTCDGKKVYERIEDSGVWVR